MRGILQLFIFLTKVWGYVTALYFHEPSYITLQPSIRTKTSDFGFSLAYQNGTQPNLVVGSPHSDLDGHVYSCFMNNSLNRNTKCKKLPIDVKTIAKDYDENDLEQKFCLGATVVATAKYLFTCAPLWTTVLKYYRDGKVFFQSATYGTCFVYYNETNVHQFRGLTEQYKFKSFKSKNVPDYQSMYGGIGWSSLLDESNQLILVGKPAMFGDIQYINSSSPMNPSRSITYETKSRNKDFDYFGRSDNIGYAFASGNFFSERKEVFFAFSLRDSYLVGKVNFLKYDSVQKYLFLKQIRHREALEIKPEEPGTMFGSALHGADLNADGVSELLVGAPAHAYDKNFYESGALYIYLGGDLDTLNVATRRRRILGDKAGSRFGTAITTSDLDGDSLPEIIVSAPYEDDGIGALYILSGYEVNRALIKSNDVFEMQLSDLPLTQRIQMVHYRSYGYSLQVVPDIDNNGCDEIAVGVPTNARVILFKCVAAINASISLKLVNEVVRQSDNNFTVEVCVDISYKKKPTNISTRLWVTSDVIGNVKEIRNNYFDIDLYRRHTHVCKNVSVVFLHDESANYNFTAKLNSNIDSLMISEGFDHTWVRLSPFPYSKTQDSVSVTRHCIEDDCTPRLQTVLLWAGRENVTEYSLGASSSENVTVLVKNEGATVYDSCVGVRITGARRIDAPCSTSDAGAYKCYLPSPLVRNNEYKLDILVTMDKANADVKTNKLHIKVKLFNNCNNPNYVQIENDINLIFRPDNVFVTGDAHTVNVTDTAISNLTIPAINDRHEYSIINNGSLGWQDVDILVTLPKKSFVQTYAVSTTQNGNCFEIKKDHETTLNCCVNLPPYSAVRVIITINILKAKIVENLVADKIEVESKIVVTLKPSRESVSARQSTVLNFVKELSIGNNKTLLVVIAIIVAILILILIACILYKIGFFERKEKQRLDSYKASVSRGNKQSTSGEPGSGTQDDDNVEDFDIEVVEDCPFDPVEPTSAADDAALIVESKDPGPSTSQENTQETNKTKL